MSMNKTSLENDCLGPWPHNYNDYDYCSSCGKERSW
jgi:hypothetical protein